MHLNPLYHDIPELDPTKGGTLIGSSRDFVDPEKKEDLDLITHRLERLGIEGLICVGGDGTLNGLQPLAERLPTVLAPKTIDNDLGLNYPSEPDEMVRATNPHDSAFHYKRGEIAGRLRARPDGELRHARLRDRGLRLRAAASSGCAPPRRATGASPSSKSWAGTPATSRSAPRTASRTSSWCPSTRSTSSCSASG